MSLKFPSDAVAFFSRQLPRKQQEPAHMFVTPKTALIFTLSAFKGLRFLLFYRIEMKAY